MNDEASCCATFYEQDWVQALLGDSFHPGGQALSRRLIDSLRLPRGARVLDVACGTGTTAIGLARDHEVSVVGLDFSEKNVESARARAAAAGLSASLEFHVGDAAALPFADGSFDAVICECAVSTFADKAAVASELARVVGEGGRVGISDMALHCELPARLARILGPWTCVADALTVEGYQRLFIDSGLRVNAYADESPALIEMAVDMKRKLVLAGLGQMSGMFAGLDLDLPEMRRLIDEARGLAEAGGVQYCRLSFSKGRPVVGDGARREVACDPAKGCC